MQKLLRLTKTNNNVNTILFSTDFSVHANSALTYAIKICEETNSRLVVFTSSNIPDAFQKKDQKKAIEKDEIYKQTMLESLVAELCKKHKLQTPENIIYEAKNGSSVVNNIISASKKHKADLIVVGTHGMTGLQKVLFGSTTSGLIAKSTIPVLAIPKGFKYVQIKNIVCASDIKKLAKELSALTPIATALTAHIDVLFLDYWNLGEVKERLFNKLIVKRQLSNISFVTKRVTMEKTMAEHLKNYMRNQKDSVLTMFPEEKNFFETLFFQSNTEKEAFKLNKPLLSIRLK